MIITLIGSARFEDRFKEMNRRLSLAGHVVFSLAVYPSDMGGKDWYTPGQKVVLDDVHKQKIEQSDAVYLIEENGYIGESTRAEIEHARKFGKRLLCAYPLNFAEGFERTCPLPGCPDPGSKQPCPLCYE